MRAFTSQQSRRAFVLSALLLIAAATALAAPNASSNATVNILGGTSFKPNEYIKDAVHFAPATTTLRSGGTIIVSNLGTDREGHTLSLVKKSDLPRTLDQVNNCAVCVKLFKAHGLIRTDRRRTAHRHTRSSTWAHPASTHQGTRPSSAPR